LVKPPEYTSGTRDTWSQAEVRRFLAAAANDRLNAAWRLTLYGLRRGEGFGLRWSDLDLKARRLTVSQSRIVVDYKVYVEPPKTRNGQRTLPLDDALVAVLTALRKRLARESEGAASAYEGALPALDWYSAGDRYVVVDELGTPVHPEWYSDEFARLLARVGLPKIRLHDYRHTALSLMEKAGVPISVVSKWAAHYDAAFTMKTYVHASDEDLKAGVRSLARLHKIA
jgi:integrase